MFRPGIRRFGSCIRSGQRDGGGSAGGVRDCPRPWGLAATCDSVVDPSPGSTTRCRFHFTFTLAPLADPVDLAALAIDLTGIPEAAGRSLQRPSTTTPESGPAGLPLLCQSQSFDRPR
jgi:hypothetical protein